MVSQMLIGQDQLLPQAFTYFLEEIWCNEKGSRVCCHNLVRSQYRTMANVTCELVWLIDLLTELGFRNRIRMLLD